MSNLVKILLGIFVFFISFQISFAEDISVLENVCGHQALKAKLSSCGKILVLTGVRYYPKTDIEKVNTGNIEELFRLATIPNANIAYSNFPPKNSSGFIPIQPPEHFFIILDLAVTSDSYTRQLAFIARESKAKFPLQNELLSIDEKTDQTINFWKSIQTELASEILYVMSLENDKKPKKICVIRENVPMNTIRDISMVSMCWSDDRKSLFYFADDAIVRVSLDGKKERIYEFMGMRKCISFLKEVKEGVTFMEQTFNGPPSQRDMIPSLVTISDQGVVLSRRSLEIPFNPETPETNIYLSPPPGEPPTPQKRYFVTPDRYNFAIIGETKYATLDKEVLFDNKFSLPKYTLSIRSLKNPQKLFVQYEFTDKTIPFYYNLCSFTPGDKEIIFTKKVNVGGNYTQEELPENLAEKQGILPCTLQILPAQK
jgi:hypothetical protein